MHVQELEELKVLRVLSVSTIFTENQVTATRKYRECAALLLKWEGETEYISKGVRIRSNATHPVFLPKGSSYEWKCTQAGHYTIVEFDTDLTYDSVIGFSISDGERLRVRLRELELCSLQQPRFWQLRAIGEVSGMLLSLFCSSVPSHSYFPTQKLERISPAVAHMTAHYNEQISNEQLAEMCGVSTVYFRKLFTAAYGISPIRYLGRLRIQKAMEMLKSDYGTLAGVATSVGYPNVYHFSKMFRAEVGISPGAYAKKK